MVLPYLAAFVVPIVPAVGKDHQPIVRLGPNDTSDALRGLSDRIEVQKVLFANLIVRLQIL
jgi:hypothetical protein